MHNKFFFLSFFLLLQSFLFAQKAIDSIQKLEEVIIESQRIAIPFSKASHAITVITSDEIQKSTATTVEELVQQVIGVDIRTKGIEGMQADLYIRGGNFNQTLLLIDGLKMDDAQTGHHTLNGLVNIENIERIEVIKGAASRIYGQNAMNGAINIVTKNIFQDITKIKLNLGSFENYGALVSFQKQFTDGNVYFQLQKQQAMGYRYNTDFNNLNSFFKGKWKNYSLIASFGKRDFGANGFYASPKFIDQYEETQTNLIALKGGFQTTNWKIKPTIYWRQNQDLFLLVRDNPTLYRNKHINNKVGASIDATISTNIGNTGIGVDINKSALRSNNLGNRQRWATNLFVEQQFKMLEDKLDLTTGVALTNYSDFGFFFYPGFNIGYQVSNSIKLYTDMGYTSRIPTYTNLYYSSKTEQGDANLKPEKAWTYEAGIKINKHSFHANLAYFNRTSTDLIDWVKDKESDLIWQANNIAEVQTKGLELESSYTFQLNANSQKIKLGYAFMDDKIATNQYHLSRYSLNSYKHRFVSSFSTKFFSFLEQTLSYRFSERSSGENYHLLDAALTTPITNWNISLKANNLLNTAYTETNLVPMPGFNYMLEVSYSF